MLLSCYLLFFQQVGKLPTALFVKVGVLESESFDIQILLTVW